MTATLTVAPRFAGLLEAAGLDRLEQVMAFEAPPSAVTRAVPGRFTVRLPLPAAAVTPGGPSVLYLKRYHGLGRARAAAHEWKRLAEAALAGIPCPEPVAFGERRGLLGLKESFLLTAEIQGAEQADWWIEDRRERRADLLRAIGGLARRFHDAGFHHQDLYLCHFFVREAQSGGSVVAGPVTPRPLALFLIDLQRCGRHNRRRRWIVKDLAQLHSSLPAAGLGEEDWETFLESYGRPEPPVIASVLRKSAAIRRHVPRFG